MRVHARRLEVVRGKDLLDLRHQLMPDPKGRGRAAHVGLARAAAAEARIEAHAKLVPARAAARLAVRGELPQRARVVLDAERQQLGQVSRQLLRAQADPLRRDARSDGPSHLVAAARVDVQPERVEELQHRGIGKRLHGEAHGRPVRVRELEREVGLPLQRLLIVHVEGRAELLAQLERLLRC